MDKVCSICKKTKDISMFPKASICKDGHRNQCCECFAEKKKVYYDANKEKIAKYQVAYRAKNLDKKREKDRLYYWMNKERLCNYQKKYLQKNKDELYKKHKLYNLANKEKKAKIDKTYALSPAQYEVYADQLSFAEKIREGADGELLVFCTYCGKMFTPTVREVHRRAARLKGQGCGEARLYCSEACKDACPSYRRIKYWKFQKVATSREVSAQFRQLVLKRDNWTCQRCGNGTEAKLHVHHIEGATQQPGMSNDLENGITLCKACHKLVHSQKGCKYYELRCPKK